MGQAVRWEKIAREWNGRYYPAKGMGMEQKVVAARDGYLAVIGTTVRDHTGVAYAAIRFPRGGTWQSLSEAITRDPAVLKALGKKDFPRGLRKRLKVEEGLLWFDRPYLLRPGPEGLAALATAFLAVLPGHVGRFDGRCEVCRSVPVAEPVLVNGAPTYLCAGCVQAGQQEEVRAERVYASRAANPALGLLTGAGAALVGGLAWAVLAVLTGRIYSAVAIGIGALVAYAVKGAMGKVNLPGQVVTALLTLAGVFAGQVFYVAHLIQSRTGSYDLPVALQVYLQILQVKPTTELATFFFALLGVALSLSGMRRPRFRSKVERI
ncbi:MAG: hypothetical protein L0214_07475 [candidate division NC10 bacterium]|nr:hypothetical protein [candidate division NC10 bacterium]